MTFPELAKARFSVRKFSPAPIEEEKLQKILEVGNIAPTAMNAQPQRIFVVKSAEGLEKANRVSPCIYGAPVVLIFAYNKGEVFHNKYDASVTSGDQDVSIVGTHIMLAAQELGINSCWVNNFSPEAVKAEFGLSDDLTVVFLMPIGYAAEGVEPAPRHTAKKPLGDTVAEL